MDLLKSYKGVNINIKVNTRVSHFEEIIDSLKIYNISFNSFTPFFKDPPIRFDISFGRETDFQDLYILVKILNDFGLQTVFYSDDINNEVMIGTYITQFGRRKKETEGVMSEVMLSLPFSTTIDYFLKKFFGVNASDIDPKLNNWICDKYIISNPNDFSQEEVERVTEISCNSNGIESLKGLEKFINLETINLSDNKISDFDLTHFQKLKKLDCSYCPIRKINISNNFLLEYIRYEGLRGENLEEICFSGNPKLKKIIGGQDGLLQIDLSNNPDIEDIDIRLSQNLRFIDLKACFKLKRIRLWGVLIPYVDLTKNCNLEHVEINYLNTFKGKRDEYGPGYPRPFIFVNEGFDKNSIHSQDLQNEYYTFVLVRVKKDSTEEKVLQELNGMKQSILEISNVATFHYQIMGKLGLK